VEKGGEKTQILRPAAEWRENEDRLTMENSEIAEDLYLINRP
jgi:hypothetical protein